MAYIFIVKYSVLFGLFNFGLGVGLGLKHLASINVADLIQYHQTWYTLSHPCDRDNAAKRLKSQLTTRVAVTVLCYEVIKPGQENSYPLNRVYAISVYFDETLLHNIPVLVVIFST